MHRPLLSVIGALVCAALLVPPSLAADIPVSPTPPEVIDEIDLRVREGAIELSLEEAIRFAIERNLTLVAQRLRIEEVDLQLFREYGIYDIGTNVATSALEETSPAASNLDGAAVQISERQSLDFTLSRLVPAGGTVTGQLTNSRTETNSFFATLNPSFRVNLDVVYQQPLLRGLGAKNTNYRIRLAQIDQDISFETFESQVNETLRLVEEAYWNLVESLEQLKVAEESLSLARQLHEQNKVRVEVGTLAPLELVQSEAGIATREEEIIRARAAVGDGEDQLRQILHVVDPRLWTLPIRPTTEPEIEPVQIDLERAIETGLARRPDIKSKRRQQERQSETLRFVRNQQLPQLVLDVRYGYNGLGGDVTNRDFFTGEILSTAPGDYGDAAQQIIDRDFDGWQVSLNLAYPIQNRDRRAATAQAEVALERGAIELRDLELTAMTQIRRLARAVDTARQARESARVSRRLEEKNLEAEQKRYDNGMSTSYQVLEIQEDLTAARSREVRAITGYRRALILYHQATGELIEESGVELVDME